MQYNLDFLNTGTAYPPASEAVRIKEYYDSLKLYNGNLKDVFKHYLERITGGDYTATAYFNTLNYFKLLTAKTADLVCGEKPNVLIDDTASDTEKANVKACAEIINAKMRAAVIDFSRSRETVIRVYVGNDGKPKVAIMSPAIWVPVVSEEDNSEILYQVIAYPEKKGDKHYLHVQIHSNGQYEKRLYSVPKVERSTIKTDDNQSIAFNTYLIGSLEGKPETIKTGINGFAIFHVANEPTTDNIHGTSDYDMISPIVAEMEIRFAQIAKILDKHADPNMAGGVSNFDFDVNGKISGIRTGGRYWCIGNDEEKPQYITWDGQLTAAFKQIEELNKQLEKISEMGAVISDNTQSGGGTEGYEALQVKMVNARLKARRITAEFDPVYKNIIRALYQLMTGNELKYSLSVTWNDGLPNDALRDAQTAQAEIQAGLISKQRARMEYKGMTASEAENEQAQIDEEQPAAVESVFV